MRGAILRLLEKESQPTLDFQGYNFWLNKLNTFNGNFVQAEMVKAFLKLDRVSPTLWPTVTTNLIGAKL